MLADVCGITPLVEIERVAMLPQIVVTHVRKDARAKPRLLDA